MIYRNFTNEELESLSGNLWNKERAQTEIDRIVLIIGSGQVGEDYLPYWHKRVEILRDKLRRES